MDAHGKHTHCHLVIKVSVFEAESLRLQPRLQNTEWLQIAFMSC